MLSFLKSSTDLPLLYGLSPLPLSDLDEPPPRVKYQLHGSSNVSYTHFPKSEFRILVIQDTGDVLNRFLALYDLRLEQESSKQSGYKKEIETIAHYLFGLLFQTELKQTLRIHCEPSAKLLANKTLVIRTYHFNANYEDALIKKGSNASPKAAPQKYRARKTPNGGLDVSWTAFPATKIDHDFGASGNLPIAICFILPFDSHQMPSTVGSNFQEFEKWLYEVQDLTLKYLKKYYYDQAVAKSTMKNFTVDSVMANKIHFRRLILQPVFLAEKVLTNYYNRLRIFLNSPRLVTGLLRFEALTSSKNQVYQALCREVRNWMVVHDSGRYSKDRLSFLAQLLGVIYPLRYEFGSPSDKRKRVLRLVFHEENEAVITCLMTIIAAFLPDWVLKYERLTDEQFRVSQNRIAIKGPRNIGHKLQILDLSTYSLDESALRSPTSAKRGDGELPERLELPRTLLKSSQRLNPLWLGRVISSPKAIPTNQAALVNSNAEIISVSESSLVASCALDEFSVGKASFLEEYTPQKSSRSSSFLQDSDFFGERKLSRNLSIADLTQKSIRGGSAFKSSQTRMFQRTPTLISSIKGNLVGRLQNTVSGLSMNEKAKNVHIVAVENPKRIKQEMYQLMYEEVDYQAVSGGAVEVFVEGVSQSFDGEKADDMEYVCESVNSENRILKEVLGLPEEHRYKVHVPSSDIHLPPIVGQVLDFIPEFAIQTVKSPLERNTVYDIIKQDLFHNQYIDELLEQGDAKGTPVSTLFYVDLYSQEILKYEVQYDGESDSIPEEASSSSSLPLVSFSKDILTALPAKTEIFRQSPALSILSSLSSPLRSSLASLWDRGGSFSFEGKDFMVGVNRVIKSRAREEMEELIETMMNDAT